MANMTNQTSRNPYQKMMLAKYKPHIVPGQKSSEEMRTWLEASYDVEEISLADFSSSFQYAMRYNAEHAYLNQSLGFTKKDFLFTVYKVMDTIRNRDLGLERTTCEDFSYILWETKTGYMYSNCPKLFSEYIVVQGISQEEYDNDTPYLLYYIKHLDSVQGKLHDLL